MSRHKTFGVKLRHSFFTPRISNAKAKISSVHSQCTNALIKTSLFNSQLWVPRVFKIAVHIQAVPAFNSYSIWPGMLNKSFDCNKLLVIHEYSWEIVYICTRIVYKDVHRDHITEYLCQICLCLLKMLKGIKIFCFYNKTIQFLTKNIQE